MIDKGKGAVKTPGTLWSIPLINVIRIQLNNILRPLFTISFPPFSGTGHSTTPSEGTVHANETLAERRRNRKVNRSICIQCSAI